MDEDRHAFGAGALNVEVKALGAELCSVRHDVAGEMLWSASSPWPRHSPVLFPIVGRVNGDHLHLAGKSYPMSQHGFAREHAFTWLERGEAGCRLALEETAETLTVFPFRFRLELAYEVQADRLSVTYTLSNPGAEDLYASLGAHPGFRWPLAEGVAEAAHEITFAADEPEPLRRVQSDGLLGGPKPSPVDGRRLPLDRALFVDGALVFDQPVSRSLTYAAPGAPSLEISWQGFEALGLWAREGGAFLCIEPWRGLADPEGFHADFTRKPGVMRIAPGEAETMTWSVHVTP